MTDKGLIYAIGASLLVHGLALRFGGEAPAPASEPPRVLEARLLPEEVVPAKRIAPLPARPVHPALLPTHPAPPLPHPEPPPRPKLIGEARQAPPPQQILSAPAAVAAPVVAATAPLSAPLGLATGGPSPASAAVHPVSGPGYVPPSVGASYLDNPKPGYPLMARRRGLEGTVRLEVRVSAEGIPIAVKLKESAGHETLDEAAIVAVWHWRFTPARRGGEAVEGLAVVPVRFRLGGDEGG